MNTIKGQQWLMNEKNKKTNCHCSSIIEYYMEAKEINA